MELVSAVFKSITMGIATIEAVITHDGKTYKGNMDFELEGRDAEVDGELATLKDLIEAEPNPDFVSFWLILYDNPESLAKIESAIEAAHKVYYGE